MTNKLGKIIKDLQKETARLNKKAVADLEKVNMPEVEQQMFLEDNAKLDLAIDDHITGVTKKLASYAKAYFPKSDFPVEYEAICAYLSLVKQHGSQNPVEAIKAETSLAGFTAQTTDQDTYLIHLHKLEELVLSNALLQVDIENQPLVEEASDDIFDSLISEWTQQSGVKREELTRQAIDYKKQLKQKIFSKAERANQNRPENPAALLSVFRYVKDRLIKKYEAKISVDSLTEVRVELVINETMYEIEGAKRRYEDIFKGLTDAPFTKLQKLEFNLIKHLFTQALSAAKQHTDEKARAQASYVGSEIDGLVEKRLTQQDQDYMQMILQADWSTSAEIGFQTRKRELSNALKKLYVNIKKDLGVITPYAKRGAEFIKRLFK